MWKLPRKLMYCETSQKRNLELELIEWIIWIYLFWIFYRRGIKSAIYTYLRQIIIFLLSRRLFMDQIRKFSIFSTNLSPIFLAAILLCSRWNLPAFPLIAFSVAICPSKTPLQNAVSSAILYDVWCSPDLRFPLTSLKSLPTLWYSKFPSFPFWAQSHSQPQTIFRMFLFHLLHLI